MTKTLGIPCESPPKKTGDANPLIWRTTLASHRGAGVVVTWAEHTTGDRLGCRRVLLVKGGFKPSLIGFNKMLFFQGVGLLGLSV